MSEKFDPEQFGEKLICLPGPPLSEKELLRRANNLTGKTLRHLADTQKYALPESLKTAKGVVGTLLENVLGATAGPAPEPDFIDLGIELKTIPLNKSGLPKESTFVCVVSLLPGRESTWKDSLVKRKLSRVLWIPVEADNNIPVPERRIGSPLLWSPNRQQEDMLRTDWEELMTLIMTGEIENISARMGQYLQIRPKAVDSRSTRRGINRAGNTSNTLPRGFYLRSSFTRTLLD